MKLMIDLGEEAEKSELGFLPRQQTLPFSSPCTKQQQLEPTSAQAPTSTTWPLVTAKSGTFSPKLDRILAQAWPVSVSVPVPAPARQTWRPFGALSGFVSFSFSLNAKRALSGVKLITMLAGSSLSL